MATAELQHAASAMQRAPRQARVDRVDTLWYKDAIIYQLHVRAFRDSNNDGIGDFRGLTERLDYIQDLGVTAIWLQPFFPSPLKDDGYDIADYTNVNPQYGTLDDFQRVSRRGPSPRFASHHRAGDEPHVGSARVVSAIAPRAGRLATGAIGTCGATRPTNTTKRGSSFRISNRPTGVGTRSPAPISGTASTAISPT